MLEAWFDGRKVLSLENLMYRKTSDIGINLFYFSTFFGGNDPSWAPAADQVVSFDNFRISTLPEVREPEPELGKAVSFDDPDGQQAQSETQSGGGGRFAPGSLVWLLLFGLTVRWLSVAGRRGVLR